MDREAAAEAMDALGHEARLEIFRALVRAGDPGLSVAEVQARLSGMPRSTLAHHLQKLVAARLVVQEKVGASVVTRANFEVMRAVVGYLVDECCVEEGAVLTARSGVT
ncbi:MAG: helix-turn-helix domain-containing protein [Chloroflexi bacterium]|nr:helix-turn-helix domain-containing protein [Chloroflexota bacterium]MDA1148370.1 helix-turn-helix domain-containing protein [Chloroflexota bacterium]